MSKPTFVTLPYETICNIAENLELPDKLKLRLVLPKTHEALIPRHLRRINKRVYVQPTKKSLDNFADICAHPLFQGYIEEVVFVPRLYPKSLVPDTIQQFRGMLPSHAINNQEIGVNWRVFQALVREHVSCIEGHYNKSVLPVDTIAVLNAGLINLPNLIKVSVSSVIKAEGFNACSFWYDPEYAVDRIGNRPHMINDDVSSKWATAAFSEKVVTEGADVMLKALNDPRICLQELEFGSQWSAQLPFLLEAGTGRRVGNRTLRRVAIQVTTVSISCEESKDLHGLPVGGVLLWKDCLSAAENVTSLTIYVTTPPTSRANPTIGRERTVVEHAMLHSEMPKLQHLKILGRAEMPGVVDATLVDGFIRRHATTLESVDLSGIVFSKGQLEQTLTTFLDARRQEFQDTKCQGKPPSKFTLKVYPRDDEQGRWRSAFHRYSAEYLLNIDQRFSRSMVEKLGVDLDVAVKDGCWDFGEYVMREEVMEE